MAHFILNGQGYLPGPNGKAPTVEGVSNISLYLINGKIYIYILFNYY